MARSKAQERKAKAAYSRKYRKENPGKVLAYNRRTIKQRASRNKARKIMARKYGKSAIKGKEIHHKSGNALNNSVGNLKIARKGHGGGTKGRNRNAAK